jgi:hypothetical protein
VIYISHCTLHHCDLHLTLYLRTPFRSLDTGYINYGVRNFWFDASEPENLRNAHLKWRTFDNKLGQPQGTSYSQGTNQQVICKDV